MSEADTFDALPIGYAIAGYEITRVLGSGGFGITYEATNPVIQRRVAIKEFFPSGLARRDHSSHVIYTQASASMIAWALEKFKATTTLLYRLHHPNILQVLDYLPANGTGYMIMEYLEGRTFEAWLDQMAPHRPEVHQLRPVLDPILEALAYVHGQGLIHRDIAPDNIVITDEGRPVLIDFGALSKDVSNATRHLGTMGIAKQYYTAPEQARRDAKPTPAADIYSFGAVLYRALAGEPPEDGTSRTAEVALGGDDPYRPLSAQGWFDPVLAAAADACLALRRTERPHSVQALRERLGWAPVPLPAFPHPPETWPESADPAVIAVPVPPLPEPVPDPAPISRAAGSRGEAAFPAAGSALAPPDDPRAAGAGGGIGRSSVLAGAAILLLGGAAVWLLLPRGEPSASHVAGQTSPGPARPGADPARGDGPAQQRLREEAAAAQRRQETALACDRAAGSPGDADRNADVPGVETGQIKAAEAVPACRAALDAAGTSAPRRLQFQLGRALAADKAYPEALVWYQRAAEGGSAAAMTNLGILYRDGLGVAQDHGRARTWFEKAAAAGSALAMANLGLLYRHGRGVAQDFAQARSWFEKAAAAGHVQVANDLGLLYRDGLGGAQDYAQARRWFEKAAEAGNASAMTNLGALYQDGLGVTQDYAQARAWFERAAAAGHAGAINNLGLLYEYGFGVARDLGQARQLYERAAAAGSASAMANLGGLYEYGSGVARDFGQARAWYERAALAGDAAAMAKLAALYESGRGGAQDLAQARTWYERAAAKGNRSAQEALSQLDRAGRGRR